MRKLLLPLFILSSLYSWATTTQGDTRNVNIDGFVTIGATPGANGQDWETDEVFQGWSGTAVPEGVTSWYLSWDDDNLYLGKTSFSEPDNSNDIPSLLYLKAEYDGDPGYSNDDIPGGYDQVEMDFDKMGGINFMFYFKTGYDEYRTFDNGWSGPNQGLNPIFQSDQADPNGGAVQMDHMEVAIPWDVITNGNGKPSNIRAAMIEINPNNGECPNSGNIFGESPWGDGISSGPSLGTNDGGVADAQQPGGCPGSVQYPVQPTIERWWGCYPVIGGVSSNGWVAEAPDAGDDLHLCESDVVTMRGNEPSGEAEGTWTWSGVKPGGASDPVIDDPNSPTTTISNIDGYGIYEFEWNINYGNCPAPPDVVVVTRYGAPPVADAGADDTLNCDVTNTVLAGNDPDPQPFGGGNGLWTVIEGAGDFDDDTNPTSGVSNMAFGLNTYRWTITPVTDTCDGSFDEVSIYVPQSVDAGQNQIDSIALGETYNLVATDPNTELGQDLASGQWTILSGLAGASIANETAFATTISGMDTGTYQVQWVVENRDCPTDDKTDVIHVFAPPSATVPNNRVICDPSEEITLTANNPKTTIQSTARGYWQVQSDTDLELTDSTSHILDLGALAPGNYTFTWTTGNFEHDEASANVSIIVVNDLSSVVDAGADFTSSTDNITLNAVPLDGISGYSGIWQQISGQPASINSNSTEMTDVILPGEGTFEFEWTVSLNGCEGSDTVKVTRNGQPEFTIDYSMEPDLPIGCIPFEVIITLNNSDEIVGCDWDFGDGTTKDPSTDCAVTTHTFEAIGEYVIRVAVLAENGARDTAYIPVTVQDAIEVDYELNVIGGVEDITATFTPIVNAEVDDFYWTFDGKTSTDDPLVETVAYGSESVISITGSNEYCEINRTDTIQWPEIEPFIPTVFTPDGNGSNDNALVELPDIIDDYTGLMRIIVYDRWGILMKDLSVSDPLELKWDGTNLNNQACPEGTYYIMVYLGRNLYTGYLTLLLDSN